MKFWLASFPRSGNTFFRNVLYYVYGIESSTFHKETAYPVDENYEQYFAVKTHLLPDELEPADPDIPAVYLVRDGRDAMVSIAHHRRDIVVPGSDLYENMREAILAAEGSFFGGWSTNANEWIKRASLVIRFEDLVKDPIAEVERLREFIDLPEAQPDKLPDFKALKSGKPKYGGEFRMQNTDHQVEDFAQKFFRKGRSGGWKEEMPEELQDLFWRHHGHAMERLGYELVEGSVGPNPDLDYQSYRKLRKPIEVSTRQRKVLIEANKLMEPGNDGIKRYLVHMLKGLEEVGEQGDPGWEFDLLHHGEIVPLSKYKGVLQEFIRGRKEADAIVRDTRNVEGYEKLLLGFKSFLKNSLPSAVYAAISNFYKTINVRAILRAFKKGLVNIRNYRARLAWKRRLEAYDLIHIPLPQNYEAFRRINNRYLVTVHDLTHKFFPEFHRRENIDQAERGMQFALRQKADMLAISENTLKDTLREYRIERDKLHLVYEAADNAHFRQNFNRNLAELMREKYGIGEKPYLLCLSTIEPRKNLPNTIRAFNELLAENPDMNLNLVIAGKYGWKKDHLYDDLHLDNPHIIFTGFIEDHDLSVLYSEAVALCYVSHYEGFGLPPLEAMCCRTPVIYGNNSSMVEVVADCGLPAQPEDVVDIKVQMGRMAFDDELRESLANAALRRSFRFSERRNIHDTLQLYRKLIGN